MTITLNKLYLFGNVDDQNTQRQDTFLYLYIHGNVLIDRAATKYACQMTKMKWKELLFEEQSIKYQIEI